MKSKVVIVKPKVIKPKVVKVNVLKPKTVKPKRVKAPKLLYRPTNKNMYIIVDSREHDIISLLKTIKPKYEWKTETIKTGDFAIVLNDKTIIFERKTRSDLKSSRIDGRIENLHNMTSFTYKFLILEETLNIYNINLMSLRYQIPILLSKNPLETINLIEHVAYMYDKDKIDTKIIDKDDDKNNNKIDNIEDDVEVKIGGNEDNNKDNNEPKISDLEKLTMTPDYKIPIDVQLMMSIPGIGLINATKLYNDNHTFYSLYLKRNMNKIKLSDKTLACLTNMKIHHFAKKLLMTLPTVGAVTADYILKYYKIEDVLKTKKSITVNGKSYDELFQKYLFKMNVNLGGNVAG